MNPKPAFEAEFDASRNIVRTRFSGVVTAARMKAAVGEVDRLLPRVRPGFAILADLSALDSMDLECAPYMAKIMDLCKAAGVSLVIRVIPDPRKDIGLNILSLTHYRGQARIVTCETSAEAERALQ